MKSVFHIVILSLYFFIFLISETSFNLYLSWDRIIPQFLFLSLLNTVSFFYLLRNNKLLISINSAIKERIIKLYSLFILVCFISIFFADNFSESVITFSQYFTYLLSFIAIYTISKLIGKTFLKLFIFLSITALFIESSSILYNAVDRVLIKGETLRETTSYLELSLEILI